MDTSECIVMDEPDFLEERRDNRPRSNTWPLPEPPDFRAAKPVEVASTEPVEPLKQLTTSEPKKSSRKNAWGNYSYADLITQAIQSSPDKRLTLSQIYDWMVNTVPYFRDKGDSNSSAGWKNSIRHNLSLHSKFVRVQNEGNGKSSWWVINPDAKGAKTSRRRSGSLDSPQKSSEKRRGRTKKDKIKEESDRPGSPRLTVGRNFNRSGSPGNLSPTSSSSDSLLTVPELAENESPLPFPLNDSFGRPRTSSNASTVSSIGRLSPIPAQDDDECEFENSVSPNSMPVSISTPNPAAEELTVALADGMTLEPYGLETHRIKQSLSPGSSMLQRQNCSSELNLPAQANISTNLSNGFDTSFDSGFFQPVQQNQPQQSAITQEMVQSPSYTPVRITRPAQFQTSFAPQRDLHGQDGRNVMGYTPNGQIDSEMEIQQAVSPQINLYENYENYNACNANANINPNHVNTVCNNYESYMGNINLPSQQTANPTDSYSNSCQSQLGLSVQRNCAVQNPLEFVKEKFPSDLELDAFNYGGFDCDMDSIITDELNMGDGGFDFNFEQLVASVPNTPVTVGELTGRLY